MAKKAKKKWVSGLHEGGLHESLGVPLSEKLVQADIERALRMGGKAAKQARAAKTLAKLRKRRKKGK